MIASITFNRYILVSLSERLDRFESDEWSIIEDEPGRVSLFRRSTPEGPRIIVQDMPYTLCVVDEPSGSSDSKAAEAPAGNPADAGANPAPTTKKNGRKGA